MRKEQREHDEERFFMATMGKKVDGKAPLATLIDLAFSGAPKLRKRVAEYLLEFEGMKVHKTKRQIEIL